MAGQPLDKHNIIRVRLSLFQNDDLMYGSVFCTLLVALCILYLHSAFCILHFARCTLLRLLFLLRLEKEKEELKDWVARQKEIHQVDFQDHMIHMKHCKAFTKKTCALKGVDNK